MPIETAIVAIIQASPAVTAILGTPKTRFYPDAIPIGVTYPAAAYQLITTTRLGRKLKPTTADLVFTIVQITIHAKTASERAALSEAIRTALVGRVRETWADTYINAITAPSGSRDTMNATTGVYERQLDIPTQYREP